MDKRTFEEKERLYLKYHEKNDKNYKISDDLYSDPLNNN